MFSDLRGILNVHIWFCDALSVLCMQEVLHSATVWNIDLRKKKKKNRGRCNLNSEDHPTGQSKWKLWDKRAGFQILCAHIHHRFASGYHRSPQVGNRWQGKQFNRSKIECHRKNALIETQKVTGIILVVLRMYCYQESRCPLIIILMAKSRMFTSK